MGLLTVLSSLFGSRQGVGKLRGQAIYALNNHARRYHVEIPKALKQFYQTDFKEHHLKCFRGEQASFGSGTFQVAIVPPSWLSKGDDAISGPQGEWTQAKYFLPLFEVDQGVYLVVDLRTEDCQIGWFEEGGFSTDEEGYKEGVEQLNLGLSSFLQSLQPLDEDAEEEVYLAEEDEDFELWWEEDYNDDGARAFDVD